MLILKYLWYRFRTLSKHLGSIPLEIFVLCWLRPLVRDYLEWEGNTPQRMRERLDVEERHKWAYKRPEPFTLGEFMYAAFLISTVIVVGGAWIAVLVTTK